MLSTARDMFYWHRALTDEEILSANARAKLFSPYTPEPDSASSYAYGWNILDTKNGRIAWHDGGNSWSLANYTRSLNDDAMAFWVSNHAYQEPGWNFEDLEPALTLGLVDRARSK